MAKKTGAAAGAGVSAETAAAVAEDSVRTFPCALYRKAGKKELKRFPEGFEVRRVENADDFARLGPEWKDSPAGMHVDHGADDE